MLDEGMSRDYPKRSYASPDRMGAFVGVKEGGYTCDLSDIRLYQVQTFDEYAPSGGARGLFPIFVARRT